MGPSRGTDRPSTRRNGAPAATTRRAVTQPETVGFAPVATGSATATVAAGQGLRSVQRTAGNRAAVALIAAHSGPAAVQRLDSGRAGRRPAGRTLPLADVPEALRPAVLAISEAVRRGEITMDADQERLLQALLRDLTADLEGSDRSKSLVPSPGGGPAAAAAAGPVVKVGAAAGAIGAAGYVPMSRVVSLVLRQDVRPFLGGDDLYVSPGWLQSFVQRYGVAVASPAGIAGPGPAGDDPAAPIPEEKPAEEKGAEEAARLREEEEHRQREEADRKRREEEAAAEAKRRAEEAATAEREKEEAERKRVEAEAAQKRREEQAANEKAILDWDSSKIAASMKVSVFKEMAGKAIAGAQSIAASLDAKEQKKLRVPVDPIAKATNLLGALSLAADAKMVGKNASAACDAMKSLKTAISSVGFDPLKKAKDDLRADVGSLKAEAEHLAAAFPSDKRPAGKGKGRSKRKGSEVQPAAGTDEVAWGEAQKLLARAGELLEDAAPTQLKSSSDVSSLQAKVAKFRLDLNQAKSDLPVFPLLPKESSADGRHGYIRDREAQGVAPERLRGLLNRLPDSPDRATKLANAISVARALRMPNSEMEAKLATLLDYGEALAGAPSKISWLDGLPIAFFEDLCSEFTPTDMRKLADKISATQIARLAAKRIPARTIEHYWTGTVLVNFEGLSDSAWNHVTKEIYINENKRQISGGHDALKYALFIGKQTAAGHTVTNTSVRVSGSKEKFHYEIKRAGLNQIEGHKTVITGLEGGQAAWRQLADTAVWDALRNRRIDDGGVDYRGFDGTTWWAGKHDGGQVRTVYPFL